MKTVRLLNHTRGTVLCQRCDVADNPFTRIRGLLGRKALAPDEGLLITPCPSVHMVGMKFAIDVIFLTRENLITDWVENLPAGFHFYIAKPRVDSGEQQFDKAPLPPPSGVEAGYGKPFAALELPVGAIARSNAQLGDKITLE
jgi:uncharacterized membrane protein (UPF0127 family)